MESNDVETLYMPSRWCSRRGSPEMVLQKHIEHACRESLITRKKIPMESDIRYGTGPRQLLDIFSPTTVNHNQAPVLIFIHGGYWQEKPMNKDNSSYMVQPFVESGIHVIVPGYDLAPDVSLQKIIEEIYDMAKFLINLKAKNNWGKMWLCGHSAGAHLAATLMYSELHDHFEGYILISGVYNLVPLLDTTVNEALNLSISDAEDASPFQRLNKSNISYSKRKFIFLVGAEYESPAFKNQQQQFYERLVSSFRVCQENVPEVDHFTIVEQLTSTEYYLTKKMLAIIENQL